ncbi:hypothetical protein [Allostreptomyces psammosilenae]|uniref:Uncharacterized protein n=1 Tax=Allostreptomyces psammosilenae TaxID=1892865 RepID=A0A852ZP81_9ACTN|nr:hypothetical protein [Allostreptomyces psammosilenae]NYI04179.1 hypothetical protein [Allostreptomyces psammosilenae]
MTAAHADAPAAVPPVLRAMCDDAALFPPANTPMPEAVTAHRRYHAAWYRALIGSFVCPDTRLEELRAALDARPDGAAPPVEPLPVVLVVPGGSTHVAPAIRAALAEPRLSLRGVEVVADHDAPCAEGVRHAAEALSAHLPTARPTPAPTSSAPSAPTSSAPSAPSAAPPIGPEDQPEDQPEETEPVYGAVELPRACWAARPWNDEADLLSAVLDVLAAVGQRAKLRTGGLTPEAFPGTAELAAFLAGCVARALPFKLTAGLHRAARYLDLGTGAVHHGFLNVLVATERATRGGGPREIVEALREPSAPALAAAVRAFTPEQAAAARARFVSYGTRGITEPLTDLVTLGLLTPPAPAAGAPG